MQTIKLDEARNDLNRAVKAQMREEIGEQDLTKTQRLALLEKYGFVAPRIDRNVTMPTWMERFEATQEEKPWKRRFKQWKEMTRGMVFVDRLILRKPTSTENGQKTSNPATKFGSKSTANGRQGKFSRPNSGHKNSSAPQRTHRKFSELREQLNLRRQSRYPNRSNSPQNSSEN